ncbi:hypothetical protein [Labrys wisconsinensis]|uniref:Uncharacterized protein n=1 Tax=Labrys wisconsinensis TaxID=425677 RepID=A0ABU0J3W0_9HYPH|nr:hypothetical protein [Labrys wisconsinensis]MDQ0468952.1 hypothetical protein [Labrys wisconsinensis]
MKNIQVIDGADNCTFSIFQATNAEFALLFPAEGQDLQFAEDLDAQALNALGPVWDRPIPKRDVQGIHGTLFYGFAGKRSHFPASKQEADWPADALNPAQRRRHVRGPR